MRPELISIGDFVIQSYGFFIALGAFLAYLYMANQAKKELGIDKEKISNLLLIIGGAAFLGGKALFFLEDPAYYFGHPANMVKSIGNGFVFFGSLLFAIPSIIWYFRKNKWPVWQMLDMMAITATIVHAFGRIGCFMAGCCHGVPTDSWVGVTFTNPKSSAEPLNVPLHPTQLYEIIMIGSIGLFLYWLKKRKQFDGQVFLIYLVLYSIGRTFTEMYRGDEERGYIIDGILTHSQLISLILIAVALWLYLNRKKGKLSF
ncbi:MAG: prolipoprotein diacylglyceryl transferase [Flavobacteriales bacterium]